MTPPLRPCLQPCSFLPPYPAFKPRNELDRIHQAYFNFDPIIRTWITTLPPLIGPITMPAAAQPCFYDLGGTRPGAPEPEAGGGQHPFGQRRKRSTQRARARVQSTASSNALGPGRHDKTKTITDVRTKP